MIDLHTHLLPGLDDGPMDTATSVELARKAAQEGVRTIVATPHVDHGFGVRPEAVALRTAALRDAIADAGVDVEVLFGGEVTLERLIELSPQETELCRLGESGWLLLETPLSSAAGAFDRVVRSLLDKGERIVLAHPERAPLFQRRQDALRELVERGCLVQITSASLAGSFGSRPRDSALAMLTSGLVHCTASDFHDLDNRVPGLLEGIHAADADLPGLNDAAVQLTRDGPHAILANDTPPPVRLKARGRRLRR